MITAYKYKLRPNKSQTHQIDEWLNSLRMQYNYRLGERLNWYESTRCPINSCSLVSCSIAEIKEQPDYYWQKRDLLNTKKLFPEYAEIHSQVLQDCAARVKNLLIAISAKINLASVPANPDSKGMVGITVSPTPR